MYAYAYSSEHTVHICLLVHGCNMDLPFTLLVTFFLLNCRGNSSVSTLDPMARYLELTLNTVSQPTPPGAAKSGIVQFSSTVHLFFHSLCCANHQSLLTVWLAPLPTPVCMSAGLGSGYDQFVLCRGQGSVIPRILQILSSQ